LEFPGPNCGSRGKAFHSGESTPTGQRF
jgi:hypothetical protein